MNTIQFLAEWAIRSSILIVSGALLLRALRVRDSSLRLAVWTAILAGSLAIPALTAWLPKLLFVVRRVAPVRVEEPVVVQNGAPQPVRAAAEPDIQVEGHDAGLPKPADSARAVPDSDVKQASRTAGVSKPFGWARVALMFYVFVAFALLLRLCLGLRISLRLLRSSRATGKATEGIQIRESDRVATPVALGIVRPAIVLPGDWRQWDAAKLNAVLAHERSHMRRRDPAVQLLSMIHRALLWHNPLSWFLHRQIVRVAEEVCDDAAVAATLDRTLYAEVLLDFMRRGVWRANWQGVPMARYGRADKRIDRILDGTALSRGITRWSLAAIVALGLPLVYLAACARPQTAKTPSPAVDAMAVGRKINAGDFHVGRGEYDDAIASYQDGLRLDPTSAKILLKLINAIKSCQKEERLLHEGLSCGATRNVIRPSPTPNPATFARISLGDFYLGRAEYGNAIASYEEGLKLEPFNAEIRQKLNAAIESCKKENSALNEGLKCGAGGPGIGPMAVGGQDIITTITIRGNVVIPAATVRKSISINSGEVYDPAKIDRDVTALKNTGYFDDVRVETSPDSIGTTVVIFYVHEKKDAATKPEAAPVRPAENPSPAVAAPSSALDREARNNITLGDFRMRRGEYDDAIVSYREGLKLDPSSTILRYKLNRAIESCKKENAALNKGLSCGAGGPGVVPVAVDGPDRIAGIIIRGNNRIPASTLRKSISIFPGDIHDPAKIDRDVIALKNTGYFDDVRVETSPDPTGTKGGTFVIFYVHEKKDAATK